MAMFAMQITQMTHSRKPMRFFLSSSIFTAGVAAFAGGGGGGDDDSLELIQPYWTFTEPDVDIIAQWIFPGR